MNADKPHRNVQARPAPRAIVIIPTLGWSDHLAACLSSLRDAGVDLERDALVALDGADNAEATLLEARAGVTTIATVDGGGFAAACNRGAEHALGLLDAADETALVFLNDDARLPTDWQRDLGELAGDTIGVLSFAVDGPAGRRRTFPGRTVGQLWLHDGPTLSGCAFAVRADRFQAFGGMDESFRMYGEETDLFSRMLASGLLLAESGAVVWHQGEGTMGSRPFRALWFGVRNPLRHDLLNASTARVLRTLAVTALDVLTPSPLARRNEPLAARRRTLLWPARVLVAAIALGAVIVELPQLLARRLRTPTARRKGDLRSAAATVNAGKATGVKL